jgi:hypothetical protein
LTFAGIVCLASTFTDSGTLQAGHRHGRVYSSYYVRPYVGGVRYYSGYRGYPGYGYRGPRVSIQIGTYPSYYSYGGYGVYPYYGGYPSGVYYRSPAVIHRHYGYYPSYGHCRY